MFKEDVCCRFWPFTRENANATTVCNGQPTGGGATFVPGVEGGPYVVCNPPPLPVTSAPYQVFVALDGQNFGDTDQAQGVDYQSVGCPPGFFASSVEQYCQPWCVCVGARVCVRPRLCTCAWAQRGRYSPLTHVRVFLFCDACFAGSLPGTADSRVKNRDNFTEVEYVTV